MASNLKNAALSQLRRIMLHIIKWITQPGKRSRSWITSIENGRDELKIIEKKKPSANRKFLRENWDDTFNKAKKGAEKEMQTNSKVNKLTEKQVFDDKYTLDDD